MRGVGVVLGRKNQNPDADERPAILIFQASVNGIILTQTGLRLDGRDPEPPRDWLTTLVLHLPNPIKRFIGKIGCTRAHRRASTGSDPLGNVSIYRSSIPLRTRRPERVSIPQHVPQY